MKKTSLIICISVLFAFFSSCGSDGSSTVTETEKNQEQKSNQHEKENSVEKVDVKFLEDFAMFNNHQELEDYFGAENVLATEWWVAEGTELFLVSILNPEHRNKIVLYWNQESGDYSDLFKVEAIYSTYNQDWEEIFTEGETYKSKTGIKLHDDINKLEEANGKAFNFWGFGWDYGGYAFNLQPIFEGYEIRLDASIDFIDSDEGWNKYVNVTGDFELSSESEEIQGIPIIIQSIAYLKQ